MPIIKSKQTLVKYLKHKNDLDPIQAKYDNQANILEVLLMSNRLIIFAKAPEPGAVKTRLTPFLSKNQAVELQKAFLEDLLQTTDIKNIERVIACSPTTLHPFFQDCKTKHSLGLTLQEGKDLGERMKNSLQWGLNQGFKKVIIIGCDSPTLPAKFIKEAFGALSRHEVVLGPSLDGGYYLIGAVSLHPPLFSDIAWGTDRVLTQTLEKLHSAKIPCHLLPFWYDIDRPQDLAFLKAHLDHLKDQEKILAHATMKILSSLSISGLED